MEWLKGGLHGLSAFPTSPAPWDPDPGIRRDERSFVGLMTTPTMRSLVVETLSPDFAGCAVREVLTPRPDPGEVLVRVRAASVNFPDLLMTRGEYQFKPPP